MPRVIFVYFREAFILKKCNICQTWGGDPAYKMSHFLALTRSSGSHSILLSVPWSISSLSVVSQLSLSCLSVVWVPKSTKKYQNANEQLRSVGQWAAGVSGPSSSWGHLRTCTVNFWQLLTTFDKFWQLLTTRGVTLRMRIFEFCGVTPWKGNIEFRGVTPLNDFLSLQSYFTKLIKPISRSYSTKLTNPLSRSNSTKLKKPISQSYSTKLKKSL